MPRVGQEKSIYKIDRCGGIKDEDEKTNIATEKEDSGSRAQVGELAD